MNVAWPFTILQNDNIMISWDVVRMTAPADMLGHLAAVSLKNLIILSFFNIVKGQAKCMLSAMHEMEEHISTKRSFSILTSSKEFYNMHVIWCGMVEFNLDLFFQLNSKVDLFRTRANFFESYFWIFYIRWCESKKCR